MRAAFLLFLIACETDRVALRRQQIAQTQHVSAGAEVACLPGLLPEDAQQWHLQWQAQLAAGDAGAQKRLQLAIDATTNGMKARLEAGVCWQAVLSQCDKDVHALPAGDAEGLALAGRWKRAAGDLPGARALLCEGPATSFFAPSRECGDTLLAAGESSGALLHWHAAYALAKSRPEQCELIDRISLNSLEPEKDMAGFSLGVIEQCRESRPARQAAYTQAGPAVPLGPAAQPAAPAQKPTAGDGPQLGLRLGYALPFGKADGDAAKSLGDSISGFVPLWAEAGYRFGRNFYVGGFLQYAPGFANSCPNGFSCSVTDIRLGVEAHYHAQPGADLDPWFGLGAGYEFLSLGQSSTSGGSNADAGASGFEFLNFQAGLDFPASRNLRLGPFLAFTLAQYGSESLGDKSADVQNSALHNFFLFGVRAAFSP